MSDILPFPIRATPERAPFVVLSAAHNWSCAEHRGWLIYFEYPPIPQRSFDYQASDPNGDGYPVAYGASIPECKASIDELLAEREEYLDLYAALDASNHAKARRLELIDGAAMFAAVVFITLLIVTGGHIL